MEGDAILTLEISRLARSTKQLCDIIEVVKDKKLCLKIIGSITVDCTNGTLDPMTNTFVQMSGYSLSLSLESSEKELNRECLTPKLKKKRIGRPKTTKEEIPDIFYKHYSSYLNKSLNISELSRVCELSRSTTYKYIKIIKSQ